jgi:2-succinyl-6-hydroxy-2,4-cyclohexadiene-1-carboxylate synthase
MRVELNGLEFHVEIDGAGPPLLLLHGFTGSTGAWDDLRAQLSPGTRVIALDLIGHGESAAPPDPSRYTLEWCARDLLALLDWLHLEQVNVLGYSMGGRVALHFAVMAPQRVNTLILESASPGIEDPTERIRRVENDDALAQHIVDRGIDAFVEEWEQVPLLALQPHVPAKVRDRQHALRLRNDPLGLANSLRGMGAGQQQPLWSRLGGLDVPVQLIVGECDTRYVAAARRMATMLPFVELAVVPAAGHTVHLDQPEPFGGFVTQALTSRLKIASRRQTSHCQQIDTL